MFMSWSNSPAPQAAQIVINTRPVERAAPLTHYLQEAGFTVVDMPMLALQPKLASAADMAFMKQWLAGNYQALVIVSPTAATSGLAMWQALAQDANTKNASVFVSDTKLTSPTATIANKAPNHLIAVGTATAAVLHHAALPAACYEVLQPAIANNEGMLAMPEIEQLRAGDKLLVWRGLGGRRLLVDTLQARGVHIDSIAWYERIMPTMASTQYQQWLKPFKAQLSTDMHNHIQSPKPIVIISSGTAFEHWTEVVNQTQVTGLDDAVDNAAPLTLSDFTYVVLGARLADIVAAQQLHYWRVEDLLPETIVAALQSSHY